MRPHILWARLVRLCGPLSLSLSVSLSLSPGHGGLSKPLSLSLFLPSCGSRFEHAGHAPRRPALKLQRVSLSLSLRAITRSRLGAKGASSEDFLIITDELRLPLQTNEASKPRATNFKNPRSRPESQKKWQTQQAKQPQGVQIHQCQNTKELQTKAQRTANIQKDQ